MSSVTDALWAVGGGALLAAPAVGIVAVVATPDVAPLIVAAGAVFGVVVGLGAVTAGVVPGLRSRAAAWVDDASALEVAAVEGVWEAVAFTVLMGTVAPAVTGRPPAETAFAGGSAVVVVGIGVVVFTVTSLLKRRFGSLSDRAGQS